MAPGSSRGSYAPLPASGSAPVESLSALAGVDDASDHAASATAAAVGHSGFRARVGLAHVGRRTVGISLLMMTVLLWTVSNFLASYIFSDNTYSKPFFMVYVNTSVFAISLVPMVLRRLRSHGFRSMRRTARDLRRDMCHDVAQTLIQLRRRISSSSGGRFAGSDDEDGSDDSDGEEGGSRTKLLADEGESSRESREEEREDGQGRGDGGPTTRSASRPGPHEQTYGEATNMEAGGTGRQWRRRRASSAAVVTTAAVKAGEAAAVATELGVSPVEADEGALPLSSSPSPSLSAPPLTALPLTTTTTARLDLRETAWLSLEFCGLWFTANYFAVACLEYTSVASATIFTSLSSMFTLLFAGAVGVEAFSLRKLAGVAASLAGVALVSSVDLSGQSDEHRGQFPHKSAAEIAVGDAMALLSAVVYGAYVTVMKHRVGNEDRVDMPLFFGLVGLFNLLLLWPGFVLLHLSGIEKFEMPPTGQVWAIILGNSLASFLSDVTWAYAMLLTTPVVVTVGLSLTIPLSLIGEMIQYAQYSSGIYWVGACIVVLSFVFINHESAEADTEG